MFTESPGLLERYDLAAAAGFKAVEMAFPYSESKETLAEKKNGLNLQQVLINAEPGNHLGWGAIVGKEKEFMESLHKSIEYCQALECKKYIARWLFGFIYSFQSQDILFYDEKNLILANLIFF